MSSWLSPRGNPGHDGTEPAGGVPAGPAEQTAPLRRRGAGLRGAAGELAAVGEFTLTFEVLYLEGGQRMTIYQAEPDSRDHDAMTLLSMIAGGKQTPGRLPSPGRPSA